jgi:predicted glycogen debranching enzyme
MEDRAMRPISISDISFENLIEREWISVNGLGGYASSTVCGLNTRKYHGLLVAAMSPPARRMVLLSHVEETVWTSHGEFALANNEYPGTIFPRGFVHLRAFNVEPFPRWAYQGDGFTIEKSLRLLEGKNTACVSYSLLTGEKPVTLEIRALLALRGIHELMYQWNGRLAAESKRNGQVRIPATARTPEVFFAHDGEFRAEPHWHLNAIYRRENERGYGGLEDLWKPGAFRWTLSPGHTAHLACSTEPVELERVLGDLERASEHLDRQTSVVSSEADTRLEMLVRAAESFVVRAPGETPAERSLKVIAQYPWSPAGGRTALMAFGGLFMTTGRQEEARSLLLGLAAQMRNGIIPTEYPESGEAPTYQGADTSLWFVNAIGEYFGQTEDTTTVRALFPAVEEIVETYRTATSDWLFHDPDGLIGTRSAGAARSWMDAQVGDWVVTPRQGRTVELNALWFNALMTASRLASKLGKSAAAREWEELAQKVRASFNDRFWHAKLDCCFDVVGEDGADASLRPNQIFAISLPHAVLSPDRHKAVIGRITEELLTPMGLRSLGRHEAGYRGTYAGNVVSRDGAQHQGSVYPWLLGPLATAYLKAYGRSQDTTAKVLQWIEPSLEYMDGDGLGQMCELFDGDSPHTARGAIASALGAAEMLRTYVREVLGVAMLRTKPRPILPPAGIAQPVAPTTVK